MSAAELAEKLRAAHPDADPMEIGLDQLESWVVALDAGPTSDELLSATAVAWSELVT